LLSHHLIEKIEELKKKRKAVILAHNYQLPEIQDIADYLGDSLQLSRIGASVREKVIIFCGVRFMAETAALLSTEKTVILPDVEAGCPMVDMVKAEDVREEKRKYPECPVVSYVNTSAEVKADSSSRTSIWQILLREKFGRRKFIPGLVTVQFT